MSRRRSGENVPEALRIVMSHIMRAPVSTRIGPNTAAANTVRRLALSSRSLYHNYRSRFQPVNGVWPTHMLNFLTRANTGRRFYRIFSTARVVHRYRNGRVSFRIPRGRQHAGTYMYHPEHGGYITGNGAHFITAGQTGFNAP